MITTTLTIADMAAGRIFPPLDRGTERRLRDSIRENGVIIPVLVDLDGNLVDGHQRRRIAAELGFDCPQKTVAVRGDDSVRLAVELNVCRHQYAGAEIDDLNREQTQLFQLP
jgi:ParB-like chromosome segregation protein Spo0J